MTGIVPVHGHIGLQGTGTTSLQRALRESPRARAADG
jgi:hypothetical protein